MQRESQAILALVALGRITAGEAERLLAATNADRDDLWVVGACAGAWVAQFLPSLAGLAHALLPGGMAALFHAATAMTMGMGGV